MPGIHERQNSPNKAYQPGMFLDTSCRSPELHSYSGMYNLLRALEKSYPDDVKLFNVGESEGYGSSENALEIPGIHIIATEEPKRTVFFVAGHHPEYSGPEAAYLIAERLLTAYHMDRNPNVQKMRKNTHITVIPQVDVDLYANKEKFERDPAKFWREGYGSLSKHTPPAADSLILQWDRNFYGRSDNHFACHARAPPKEALSVKKTVKQTITSYGPAFLAFDYHETPRARYTSIIYLTPENIDRTTIVEVEQFLRSLRENSGKDITYDDPFDPLLMGANETWLYPQYAIKEMERVGSGEFNRKDIEEYVHASTGSFDEFMTVLGADSFSFEVEGELPLEEKVAMILAGTDRILARYFLGV